jgi:hypothetical protein
VDGANLAADAAFEAWVKQTTSDALKKVASRARTVIVKDFFEPNPTLTSVKCMASTSGGSDVDCATNCAAATPANGQKYKIESTLLISLPNAAQATEAKNIATAAAYAPLWGSCLENQNGPASCLPQTASTGFTLGDAIFMANGYQQNKQPWTPPTGQPITVSTSI